VVTGAPSWGEYWAPVMAALPQNREMVVVDRPGFANSEPLHCVPKITTQAKALLPLLEPQPGQRILLIGQSYGAAIATLMAAANPKRVAAVVLLSSFLGVTGPTSRWLVDWGSRVLGLIPRDLRNAVLEVSHQAEQLSYMRAALEELSVPVHVLHGDTDDFAPIELAERLVAETHTRHPMHFERIAGVNHFLNDGPAEMVIECLEACIPKPEPFRLRLPKLPRLEWPRLQPQSKLMTSSASS
jgi:pimeloyl-ACP methyl ester carboxylesterase